MLSNRLNVLLVEDNPGDARLIREMLTRDEYFGASYSVIHVPDLQTAAQTCGMDQFHVILLDMNLPDSSGLSTIQHLSSLTPQVPIVILTGVHDEQLAHLSATYGAQDYIIKSECTGPLLKRIMHFAIERKTVEERFKHLAMHDPLTGLPNRILLYDRLSRALSRAVSSVHCWAGVPSNESTMTTNSWMPVRRCSSASAASTPPRSLRTPA